MHQRTANSQGVEGRRQAAARGCAAWGYVWGAVLIMGLWGTSPAHGQQKIGYVDTEVILDRIPKYASVQQRLEKLEAEWRSEIQSQRETVQALRDEFRASELLFTEAERKKKRAAIQQAQQKVQELRKRDFGPDGRLYARQKKLMRPIQERVLTAAEEVATEEGYDYVFDKSEKVLFLYAREQHNLNDEVLEALGITLNEDNQRTDGDGS